MEELRATSYQRSEESGDAPSAKSRLQKPRNSISLGKPPGRSQPGCGPALARADITFPWAAILKLLSPQSRRTSLRLVNGTAHQEQVAIFVAGHGSAQARYGNPPNIQDLSTQASTLEVANASIPLAIPPVYGVKHSEPCRVVFLKLLGPPVYSRVAEVHRPRHARKPGIRANPHDHPRPRDRPCCGYGAMLFTPWPGFLTGNH